MQSEKRSFRVFILVAPHLDFVPEGRTTAFGLHPRYRSASSVAPISPNLCPAISRVSRRGEGTKQGCWWVRYQGLKPVETPGNQRSPSGRRPLLRRHETNSMRVITHHTHRFAL